MAVILATRRAWRSSVQCAVGTSPRSPASRAASTNFAPRVSTLASLCSRALRAAASSTHRAARTPGTLLAAMAEPIPAPSTRMPSRGLAARDRAGHGQGDVGIVHGLRGEGAEVLELDSRAGSGGP